jgi:hypothetical protein
VPLIRLQLRWLAAYRLGGDQRLRAAAVAPTAGRAGVKILFVVAAVALVFGTIPGCASIAAYQQTHPYYRFPGSGGGSGANS